MEKEQQNQEKMKDEEGHLKERRIDYTKELQMFVKRGKTECNDCPYNNLDDCGAMFKASFHVDCCDIDITTLEVHGL